MTVASSTDRAGLMSWMTWHNKASARHLTTNVGHSAEKVVPQNMLYCDHFSPSNDMEIDQTMKRLSSGESRVLTKSQLLAKFTG